MAFKFFEIRIAMIRTMFLNISEAHKFAELDFPPPNIACQR